MQYFDLESARRLLPEVRSLLERAMQARAAMEDVQRRIREFAARAHRMGGLALDSADTGRWRLEAAQAGQQMREALERLDHLGAQVKDLETGLVDFPTRYRGEDVLLCWRMGEPDIEWWHGMEEGYRGRKPIDADFLAHHRSG